MRTLIDSAGSDRSQRATALVGRELDRYKVKIAALSETRLAEEVLLKEVGAGNSSGVDARQKSGVNKDLHLPPSHTSSVSSQDVQKA